MPLFLVFFLFLWLSESCCCDFPLFFVEQLDFGRAPSFHPRGSADLGHLGMPRSVGFNFPLFLCSNNNLMELKAHVSLFLVFSCFFGCLNPVVAIFLCFCGANGFWKGTKLSSTWFG